MVYRDASLRVVLVDDPDYPGFCRVIWNTHVREMSDLARAERRHCMRVVFVLEQTLRDELMPHKINLASLGNQTPHLHWHVIPRFTDDAHFPNPVWGQRVRAKRRGRARIAASKLRKLLAAELGESLRIGVATDRM